jgi:CMP-N-acetylneuraminic acid synthetase
MTSFFDVGKVYALIPARGGSKSVPKKNIRDFAGHPLIAYSIAAARLTPGIDRVIVSTDSEEIADIARYYGAEVPFLRPSAYAGDASPDIDFVRHAIGYFLGNEGKCAEYLVHLRPTTPLRLPGIISEGIDLIRSIKESTSLRSGHICASPPHKWFKAGVNHYWEPLMQDMTPDDANKPRQDFPDVYVPNGYVDVLKSDFIWENQLMHGTRMLGLLTEEIPDIDTELDMKKLQVYGQSLEAFQLLHEYLDDERGRIG